jgi:hypothetical protein
MEKQIEEQDTGCHDFVDKMIHNCREFVIDDHLGHLLRFGVFEQD